MAQNNNLWYLIMVDLQLQFETGPMLYEPRYELHVLPSNFYVFIILKTDPSDWYPH